MGVSRAGFDHGAVVEFDADTCVTLRENQRRGIQPISSWPLYEMDVRQFDYSTVQRPVDLVAGGPPCQPFSLGGKHRGHMDERNMFPEAVRAVRELGPLAFVFENVKGLLRQSFTSYFEYIILQLTYPELSRTTEENWTDHLTRLERHYTTGRDNGLTYRVIYRLLNAADYGVPQCRERVFIVGFREDLGLDWSFPERSHAQDSLLWSQWVTGDYWDAHRVATKDRPLMPHRLAGRVAELKHRLFEPDQRRWATVRDAIGDLPDPCKPEAEGISNHRFQPGARSYIGHTGSHLDLPAKTLKAGDHGVPGGENMLSYHDGRVRYFTVRESARIQTFPDEYIFPVTWTESMRQLGNAVPVRLATAVAGSVRDRINRGSGK
jgi:DNA (cytosine-5)-methyltransferase 1